MQPDQQLAAGIRQAAQLGQAHVHQSAAGLGLAQAERGQAALDGRRGGGIAIALAQCLALGLLGQAQRLHVLAGTQQQRGQLGAGLHLGAVPLRAARLRVDRAGTPPALGIQSFGQRAGGVVGAAVALVHPGLLSRQRLQHAGGQLQGRLVRLAGQRQRLAGFAQGGVVVAGRNVQRHHRNPGLGLAPRVVVGLGSRGRGLEMQQALVELALHQGQVAGRHLHPVQQRRVVGTPCQRHRPADPDGGGRQLSVELQHGGLECVRQGQRHRVVAALTNLAQLGHRRVGHRGFVGGTVGVAPGTQEGHQIPSAGQARRCLQRCQQRDHLLWGVAMPGFDGLDLLGQAGGDRPRADQQQHQQQGSQDEEAARQHGRGQDLPGLGGRGAAGITLDISAVAGGT